MKNDQSKILDSDYPKKFEIKLFSSKISIFDQENIDQSFFIRCEFINIYVYEVFL